MDKTNEPEYMGIYEDVVNVVGAEKIEEFYHHFQGQQVEFPMRLYSRNYVVKQVIKLRNEESIKSLARKFGYSERYLRKLIQQYSNNNLKE